MDLKCLRSSNSEFNRSKFIEQNYRIYIFKNNKEEGKIVSTKRNGNYGLFLFDNIKFKWSDVGLVDLIYKDSDEFVNCPICLESDLVAPKISNCGHVFCWPCILRYVYSIENENSRFKCPICYSLLFIKELVSVRYQVVHEIRVGSKMNFCLLFRKFLGSFVHYKLPKAHEKDKLLLNNDESGAHFQRLGFLSNLNEVLIHDLYLLRIKQYEYKIKDSSNEELNYIEECISIIERKLQQQNVDIPEYELISGDSLNLLLSKYKENELLEELGSEFIDSTMSNSTSLLMQKTFYFYQSHDGQLLFLEPFYVKILQFEFGDIKYIPKVLINVTVIYEKEYILDEYTIKRYKFLDHLPIGSMIKIVGIDILPLISRKTQEVFSEKLEKRKIKYKELKLNQDLKSNILDSSRQEEYNLVNEFSSEVKTDALELSSEIQNGHYLQDNYPLLKSNTLTKQGNLEINDSFKKMNFLNKVKSKENNMTELFPPLSRSSVG